MSSSYKNKASNYVINRSLLISAKRKRLRHVDYILVRNLDIARPGALESPAPAYSVWFTLHLSRAASKAVYISEKKYNTPSPKWNKIVFDSDADDQLASSASTSSRHLASKEFIVRVWFKTEQQATGCVQAPKQDQTSLRLLIEYEINLESVVQVNEEALNLPNVECKNVIVIEMLDATFSQPPPPSSALLRGGSRENRLDPPLALLMTPSPRAQSTVPRHQKTASWTGSARSERESQIVVVKSSYTLNSMLRINDFQRILCESALKIHQLKQASLAKYESTERQRELLVRKEAQLKRVQLYREHLAKVSQSNSRLAVQNEAMERQRRAIRGDDQSHELKAKLKRLGDSIQSLMIRSANLNLKLKLRQKSLLNELVGIFQLDSLFKMPSQIQQDSHINLINAILRSNPSSTSSSNSSSKGSQSAALSMSNQIAVQLGYICHIIKMLTVILNIQLRYPVIFRASMSYVMEYEAQLSATSSGSQNENSSNSSNSTSTTEFYQFVKEYPLFKPTSSSSSSSSSSNKNKPGSSNLQDDISLYAIQLLNRDLLQLRIFLNNNRKSLHAQHPSSQLTTGAPPTGKVNFRSLSINDLLANLRLVFESF